MNLSFQKRLQVADIVTKANAGKKPLVLGAGFYCLEETLQFIDETKHLQFDSYHVMPYHPLLSLDRLAWWYERIADYSPKPIWMYSSANWCQHIPPQFVARLKDHPNMAGIKFSSSHTVDQLSVIGMASDSFQVITAVVKQFYLCLCAGVSAGTTSVAGALPEPIIELYQLYKSGKYQEALQAQHKLNAFLSKWPKSIKNDNFLGAAEEKYILSLRGVCEPYVSSYYREINEKERDQIHTAITQYYPSLLPSPELV